MVLIFEKYSLEYHVWESHSFSTISSHSRFLKNSQVLEIIEWANKKVISLEKHVAFLYLHNMLILKSTAGIHFQSMIFLSKDENTISKVLQIHFDLVPLQLYYFDD